MLVPSQPPDNSSIAQLKRVALFGSTGSIGKTSLSVLRQSPEHEVIGLFANSSVELFVEQVREFKPRFAGLADHAANKVAKAALGNDYQGEWLESENEFITFATSNHYDIHIGAIVGIEGIFTALPAYKSGKRVALANKEALVVGGGFFRDALKESHCGTLLPVDSEHSSLFRLIQCIPQNSIAKIGLTASGGPFFRTPLQELEAVSVEDALAHPTWKMGKRISLDSATLMNKAFELIEAKWLFDVAPENISVKIHPQSILHGFIECSDGSQFFHGSPPDMALPITYALHYPGISPIVMPPFVEGALELLACDEERFSAIRLGRQVAKQEEEAGIALRFYTANEVAADAFLERKLPFTGIVSFIEEALMRNCIAPLRQPEDLRTLLNEERIQLKEWLVDFSRRCNK
ncbi:1-deoxy-D-xylulose-5-phosphate reductoisomerase [bacterium]|nr:1-deoxy-D-xylulose-5-phosphate reductoisomerase [bacterium]